MGKRISISSPSQDQGRKRLSGSQDEGCQVFDGKATESSPTPKKHKFKVMTESTQTDKSDYEVKHNIQKMLKVHLRSKLSFLHESTSTSESELKDISTSLYITQQTEDGSGSHEILDHFKHPEKLPQFSLSPQIDCRDIFKPGRVTRQLRGKKAPIRCVMTKGIAGIGKTFAVQNFSLDWAEEKSNQHIDLVFVLYFRELNMLQEDHCSLLNLLLLFYPDLELEEHTEVLFKKNVLFILDGLDESRFPLEFEGSKTVSDVEQISTVDVLLINIINGNLLPNSLIWITSRPAAASQIPLEYVDQMTEVRGFTQEQKEEYFRRAFRGDDKAEEVIACLRGMISFHFLGHIPIFCWIAAEVFKNRWSILKSRTATMTELYIYYLRDQIEKTTNKYEKCIFQENIKSQIDAMPLNLSKLAFDQLVKCNVLFYEEDLRKCFIHVDKDSGFCGFCSEILKEEFGLDKKKIFSFVHQSFQEFLAAFYLFRCCVTKNASVLKSFLAEDPVGLSFMDLLESVVNKALRTENGQLDLFLCFFLGFSLESNQKMLAGLLPQIKNSSKTVERMRRYLHKFNSGNVPLERCMNLLLCKYELKQKKFQDDVSVILQSGMRLSHIACSVMSTMLQITGELIEEFDLTKCRIPFNESLKLFPLLRNSIRALLRGEHLHDGGLDVLLSILQSADSSLTELSLLCFSDANIPPPHMLFSVLGAPDCKLEILRLSGFSLRFFHCHTLATILHLRHSSLRVLDLTYCIYSYPNVHSRYYSKEMTKGTYIDISDNLSLLTVIPSALIGPTCKLKELRMTGCLLKSKCCQVFASILSSDSQLRELDLSNNDLQDLGIRLLSAGLESSKCRLEILRLSGCGITKEGCVFLELALRSNPTHLRELDLSYNHPGESGAKLLTDRLKNQDCQLEKLNVDHDEDHWVNPQLLNKYACELTLDPNTVNENLLLMDDNRKVQVTEEKQPYPDHPERFDHKKQVLCHEGLTGRAYWEVEFDGLVNIGVAYKSIQRKEGVDPGFTDKICSLTIHTSSGCSIFHGQRETFIPIPVVEVQGFWENPKRVGVYVDFSGGILAFYWLSGDTKTLLHTIHTTFTELLHPAFTIFDGSLTLCTVAKLEMDNVQTCFTPEVITEKNSISYRFKFPGSGVFRCCLTGLVFNVVQESEVRYQTIIWDEALLHTAQKTAAGPLFSIQCTDDALRELHLPHCEPAREQLSDCLSVVHIADGGMSIITPQEVTDTHVIVAVSHLSGFGVVLDLAWKFVTFLVTPKRCQVLLFLKQPDRKQRQFLNVHLLPANVPVHEVKAQQEDAKFIQAPSDCRLNVDHSYRLASRTEENEIQPHSAQFFANYGPNYHPTFEMILNTSTEEVHLMIQDEKEETVWEHRVSLTVLSSGTVAEDDVATNRNISPEKLLCARKRFVGRVSDPVLNELLDGLLDRRVITDEEYDTTRFKRRVDKARDIIDMVRGKGKKASLYMIELLSQMDPYLCKDLNFS
ncbi:protein NLRC3-like isoform X2 [Thalassophryne amazonica]|nr:protein NLRC3-like isoform X2 [Thalassophryne amazonica]